MKSDQSKTKAALIKELQTLRKRISSGDITERKQVEEALRESEEHFEALIENSSDIIQVVDSEGVIRFVSHSIERILGYKPEELVGKLSADFVHPDDLPEVARGFEATIQRPDEPVVTICRCKHKDGTWRIIQGVGMNRLDDPLINGFITNMQDITERKQAEEALRASEERYRLISKRSSTYCYSLGISPEGTISVDWIGGEFTDITGYNRKIISDLEKWYAVIHLDDLPLIQQGAERVLSGEPGIIEYRLRTKDGREIWLEDYSSPVLDENKQQVTGIIGTVRDITERKQAEETLRASEQRLQSLFDTMAEGVVLITTDGEIVNANPAAERILGLKRPEIEGRNYVSPEWEIIRTDGSLMPPEEMAGPLAMSEKRLVKDIEMGTKRPDGSISWINVSAAPLINEAGELEGIVGTFADITERKQAKEALEESARRYRELIEDASDVVYTTDPNGYFTYVNPPIIKLTGYSKAELIGVLFTELISPEWRDRVQSFYIQQRDRLSRNSTLEFPIITRSGEEKWVEQKVTMLIEGGQVTSVQSIVRDITERKRAEEALREMASIDPLTSLYNRRRFSEFLAHEIDRTKRYKTDLSIIMFDIDHFKKINDTYGHKEGDNVLKMLGARMKKIVRGGDIIARWGGEEFMILAVNSDLKNAQIIAEKIRADIENQQLASTPKFTVSGGVSQFEYDDDDAASLIDRVDKALYHAKNNGRNQVQAA